MSKDILLYGSLDSYSVQYIIEKIDENLEEDPTGPITIRVNTPGGSPEYTWGIIAKLASLENEIIVKNDGKAHSAGMFFNCYAKYSECLDVTEFLVHRAAYPTYIEENPQWFDEATRGNLERLNASLRKAFEGKIDVKKFEEIKGVKVKDIFSMDNRIDVYLTAAEAKKIGLVDKVIKITPEKQAKSQAEVRAEYEREIAAYKKIEIAAEDDNENLPDKNKNMEITIEKIKSEAPKVFEKIVEDAVKTERDRVGAALAFIDIDKDKVLKMVTEGTVVSMKDIAEFSAKEIAATKKELLKKESKNVPEVGAEEAETEVKTEKELAIEEYQKKVEAKLKLKNKTA